MAVDDEPVDAIKEFSHICKECGKEFGSGKALGGHISTAHVQAKERLKAMSLLDGDSEQERHVCGICYKDFASSRSLYGHMRLHPERQWRGMEVRDHPHRVIPVRSDGGHGEDSVRVEYDLTALVGSKWGKTSRRSWKFEVPIFEPSDFSNQEEEEMVNQTARDLARMAGDSHAKWSGIGGASSDAIKVSNVQISTALHVCEICGKSFSTCQTLGGHKRCHYVGASSYVARSPSPPGQIRGERSERNFTEFDLNVPSGDQDDCDM